MAKGWEHSKRVIEDRQQIHPVVTYGCLIVLILGLAIGWWVFQSYMEAKAYNNATGETVSTWDAMWIELRVQASPKNNTQK